jgi:hypothetical protein
VAHPRLVGRRPELTRLCSLSGEAREHGKRLPIRDPSGMDIVLPSTEETAFTGRVHGATRSRRLTASDEQPQPAKPATAWTPDPKPTLQMRDNDRSRHARQVSDRRSAAPLTDRFNEN